MLWYISFGWPLERRKCFTHTAVTHTHSFTYTHTQITQKHTSTDIIHNDKNVQNRYFVWSYSELNVKESTILSGTLCEKAILFSIVRHNQNYSQTIYSNLLCSYEVNRAIFCVECFNREEIVVFCGFSLQKLHLTRRNVLVLTWIYFLISEVDIFISIKWTNQKQKNKIEPPIAFIVTISWENRTVLHYI